MSSYTLPKARSILVQATNTQLRATVASNRLVKNLENVNIPMTFHAPASRKPTVIIESALFVIVNYLISPASGRLGLLPYWQVPKRVALDGLKD